MSRSSKTGTMTGAQCANKRGTYCVAMAVHEPTTWVAAIHRLQMFLMEIGSVLMPVVMDWKHGRPRFVTLQRSNSCNGWRRLLGLVVLLRLQLLLAMMARTPLLLDPPHARRAKKGPRSENELES